MDSETKHSNTIKVTSPIQELYKINVRLSERDKKLSTYLSEKTTRISAVLVRLASLNKGHEVFAPELERSSIRLVSYAAHAYESKSAREQLLAEIGHLIALIEVGVRAYMMAASNGQMLSEELVELYRFVTGLEWGEGRLFVSAHELRYTTPEERGVEARRVTDIPNMGHEEDTSTGHAASKETYTYETSSGSDRMIQKSPQKHHIERIQDAQKDRRATILGMLQRKDRVSVRDVANVIKDCSEKTLQRELLALVAQGVLKKEGERRWSTYRLA